MRFALALYQGRRNSARARPALVTGSTYRTLRWL
jgi:hypothetical protein